MNTMMYRVAIYTIMFPMNRGIQWWVHCIIILYRDEIGNKIDCTLMWHNAMVITSGLHMIKVDNATTLDGDIKVSIVSPFFRNKHFKELFASIFLMVFTVNLCTIMLGFCIYAVACVNLWLQQSASEPFHFMHRLVFQTQISD